MEKLDLKALEKKAFRSFFKDGIYDVFLGLILLTFGVPLILNEFGLLDYENITMPLIIPVIMSAAALLFFVLGKKYITAPRLGIAHFSKQRKRKMMHVKLLLASSVLIGVLMFFLSLFKAFPVGGETGVPLPFLIFGIQALLVFSFMAYFMDFTRLYLYAFLFAISLPLTFWLKKNTSLSYPSLWVFSLTAVPILIIGCIIFIRFLIHFPLLKDQGLANE
jgi:cell division protein FtsB